MRMKLVERKMQVSRNDIWRIDDTFMYGSEKNPQYHCTTRWIKGSDPYIAHNILPGYKRSPAVTEAA